MLKRAWFIVHEPHVLLLINSLWTLGRIELKSILAWTTFMNMGYLGIWPNFGNLGEMGKLVNLGLRLLDYVIKLHLRHVGVIENEK